MNWYSIFGLSLDLIGVLFLGIDLVRVQAKLRRRAKKGRALFNKMEADFGEIESWADDIKKRSEWIPERSYSRVHGEDEVSYNARHAIETLRELSWAVNGLAEYVTEITKILYNNVSQDERLASSSFRFSIVGLTFLIFGFGLQVYGAWVMK